VKTVYCDSNFWVRLFLEFPDSSAAHAELEQLQSGNEARLPLTWLQRVEVMNAFKLLVFQTRSGASPRITPEQATIATENFRTVAEGPSFAVSERLDITDFESTCLGLSERYTAKHGFRAYDLMHVSAALTLRADAFLSFDRAATRLASLEGLKVMKNSPS
jgi:predicted nucleic acid-binding protein